MASLQFIPFVSFLGVVALFTPSAQADVVPQSQGAQFEIGNTPATAIPWPWCEASIGQSTDQGVALLDGGFVLANLGADISAAADRFKFVARTLQGDGSLIVKIAANDSAADWTRFGLMMRNSLAANDRNVLLHLATVENGLIFQSRQTAGGPTAARAPALAKSPPLWLKLDRSGSVFTASYSEDGVNWTVQGSDVIAMGTTIQVGLAFSNPSTSTWAFGQGDQLKLVTPTDQDGNGLPDAWERAYFGSTGVNPYADADGDGQPNWAEAGRLKMMNGGPKRARLCSRLVSA